MVNFLLPGDFSGVHTDSHYRIAGDMKLGNDRKHSPDLMMILVEVLSLLGALIGDPH